ncbi:PLD nuclease N-terminal domain-containing protein [Leucobacter japonicus]|uniref:PLD nuclease N-terminal domain-containing protein n=1 Tax=Leucobacter japonicus TaxID=1461259 RepID=UPI0009E25D87|nr:PLD nuclease N-terminal domain-containing protein [Leucobacter japonicus]
MVRFVIIGIVIAVAFTLYALVDAAMTDASRARGVGKPVWIVLIVVLPVIGAALWFLIGKGSPQSQARAAQVRRSAPDDDPRFTGTRLSSNDLDAHMRDLEDRLRELDNETFPGETARPATEGADDAPDRPGPQSDAPTADAHDLEPRTSSDPRETTAPETESESGSTTNSEPGDASPAEPGKRPDGDSAS